MKLVVDLSSRQPVTDIGNNSPAPTYTIKSQDTAVLNVYFTDEGLPQDLGSATTLKFGLVQSGSSTLLVLDSSFNRLIDPDGNVYYQGFPVFNTSQLLSALGPNVSTSCTGELRYQQPDGEIVHCLDIPFLVYRTILQETTSTTTTANFTQPAIGSPVAVAVGTTSFLSTGDTVSIWTHNDSYLVTAVTDTTHFSAENLGTGTTAAGTTVPSGTTVSLASPNVLATYPDSSLLELKIHKDQPSGYAGLSASGSGYISNTHVLVDGVSVTSSDPAGLATIDKLTVLSASFVQPASGATVVITVASSLLLAVNQAVFIAKGGYYLITAIAGSSVTLKNNGDPGNVSSGVTVPSGAALLSAQAVSGGSGSAGINAYTTLSSGFTVPAVGTSVSLSVGNTSWMGGNGQILFIASAGYYSIASISNATTVSVTNLGYTGNATSGTAIASGSMISPGGLIGPIGPSGTSGGTAYDKTTSSFIMPAASAGVTIAIGSTAWLATGQIIYIATAGYLQVSSITNATQFLATNLNYTGNAAASTTIAANSAVSPGGMIGPTGSGAAGKDAFTTLTNSFTQPAISATVSVVVGKTAFMAIGQVLFVQGGGYYSVSTITDAVTVVLTNLGYTGNAAVGSTVSAGSGNIAVVPAGLAGPTGTSAYTTTSASFTMPTVGNSVTVAVVSTGFMVNGLSVFVQGAGYFTVASVTDATHVVLTNQGVPGNIVSGNTIASGAGVVSAGAQGSAGSGGTGVSSLTDAETTTGSSWIYSASGVLKRIIAGTNVTLTDGGDRVTVAASGGSPGTGFWDSVAQGVYWNDDFIVSSGTLPPQYGSSVAGGVIQVLNTSVYGQDTTKKINGYYEFTTGTTSGTNQGAAMYYGMAGANNGSIVYGLGPLTAKCRMFWETSLPATAINYRFRWGIMQSSSSYLAGAMQQGFFFEFVPDNNSAQWRVGVGGASITYANTTVAGVADTAYDLEIDVNAAWTSIAFLINGTTAATVTTGIPNTKGNMAVIHARDTGTTSYLMAFDAWSIYYPFAR
jgi:hypothetical protein